MKITQEKMADVLSKLNDYNKNMACPVCGHHAWSISDTILEMREFDNGNLNLNTGSAVMPILVALCDNCGYTIMMNAVKLGILPPQQDVEHLNKNK